MISGKVTGIEAIENKNSRVFIEIYSPNNTQYKHIQVPIKPQDHSFDYTLSVAHAINGTYRAVAIFGQASNEVDFRFDTERPFNPTTIIVGSVSILGVGLGAVYAFQHGYAKAAVSAFKNAHTKNLFHRSRTENKPINHPSHEPAVMYLQFDCGLVNNHNRVADSKIGNVQIIGDINEIEEKFGKAVDFILMARNKIKENVQEVREFVEWCKEVREDPDKVLSKISNDIISGFTKKYIQPYFANLLLKGISTEININNISKSEHQNQESKPTINFKLQPIEAYIELAFFVNNIKSSSTKLIFLTPISRSRI